MSVEAAVERNMLKGKTQAAAGSFWLGNNGTGWKNPQHLRVGGDPENPTPVPFSLSKVLDQAEGVNAVLRDSGLRFQGVRVPPGLGRTGGTRPDPWFSGLCNTAFTPPGRLCVAELAAAR
jgi:hypothetical protein